jgi:hypothetical protein
VPAPTQVEAKRNWCDAWTIGSWVEWQPSTARGVIGYRVTAHLDNGTSYAMAQTDAATLEAYGQNDRTWLQHQPRFTVTTLTSYGWTAQSATSNVLPC